MNWTQLICSNLIILSPNTKQLLAQHSPQLGASLLPSPWGLQDGCMEPFFRGFAIPLMDNCPCGFLASLEALYPVEYSAVYRCFLSTNCRQLTMNIWQFNAFFPQEPCGPSVLMITAFHFVMLVHALWPLVLVTMQQFFFTGMHD